MASIRLSDVVKPFSGDGDVEVWMNKLRRAAKAQKVQDLAALIPMFLEGSAYAVFDQMEEAEKDDEERIVKVLQDAFGVNRFRAYELLRQRNWREGEPVDVYLAEIRKLAKLAGTDQEGLLEVAFVTGFPVEVASQLKAAARVVKPGLQAILEHARILIDERVSVSTAMVARAEERRPREDDGKSRDSEVRQSHPMNAYRANPMRTCWSCGKEGHMARNCRAGKGQGESRAPTTPPTRV